jgi:radical SAM enzyme (rSAM/lipoprotein system)
MPFEDFEKVLLRIKEAYDPRDILVIFSGGEPLMRKDLPHCGQRVQELGFPWGLVSNGYFLTPQKALELLNAGMRTATISLDGLEEEHDWMRGVPGSFARADAAIRYLASVSFLGFDVVTCVTQKNIGQLNQIKEYLLAAGVKAWRIFTVFPVGRGATDPALQLTPVQYRELMEFIVACRKEGRIKASYGCEGFLGPYEGKVRDHLFSCQAGLSIASVRIDGSISGCTSIRSSFGQGNIYEDDFVEVWENRFGLFRDHTPFKTGPCASCEWWKKCQGNGMHLRGENGELLLCNLERIL